MAKRLPNDAESVFLLCEDVRQELGNKQSFMGVFLNNDIVLPKGTEQMLLPSLAVVYLARGGEGPTTASLDVIQPNGDLLFSTPKDNPVIQRGQSHIMVVKIMAPLLRSGTYRVQAHFDESTFEHTFEVKYEG
jgi:hypothetical protein